MSQKDLKKKSSGPRAMPVETIITRFKSAQQKKQDEKPNKIKIKKKMKSKKVKNSDIIMKQDEIMENDILEFPTKLKKGRNEIMDSDVEIVEIPNKLKRKVQNEIIELEVDETMELGEYYPNYVKRKPCKKIVLAPKHSYKFVADLNNVKKRKIKIPQKDIPQPVPIEVHKSSNDLKQDLSIADMIILDDSLDEEDLLEILTCPSPVWWEDPPDDYSEEVFSEEPLSARIQQMNNKNEQNTNIVEQIALNKNVHEQRVLNDEKNEEIDITQQNKDLVFKNNEETNEHIPVAKQNKGLVLKDIKNNEQNNLNLNIIHKNDENFKNRRNKLESLLGNIKNKKATVDINIKKEKKNDINDISKNKDIKNITSKEKYNNKESNNDASKENSESKEIKNDLSIENYKNNESKNDAGLENYKNKETKNDTNIKNCGKEGTENGTSVENKSLSVKDKNTTESDECDLFDGSYEDILKNFENIEIPIANKESDTLNITKRKQSCTLLDGDVELDNSIKVNKVSVITPNPNIYQFHNNKTKDMTSNSDSSKSENIEKKEPSFKIIKIKPEDRKPNSSSKSINKSKLQNDVAENKFESDIEIKQERSDSKFANNKIKMIKIQKYQNIPKAQTEFGESEKIKVEEEPIHSKNLVNNTQSIMESEIQTEMNKIQCEELSRNIDITTTNKTMKVVCEPNLEQMEQIAKIETILKTQTGIEKIANEKNIKEPIKIVIENNEINEMKSKDQTTEQNEDANILSTTTIIRKQATEMKTAKTNNFNEPIRIVIKSNSNEISKTKFEDKTTEQNKNANIESIKLEKAIETSKTAKTNNSMEPIKIVIKSNSNEISKTKFDVKTTEQNKNANLVESIKLERDTEKSTIAKTNLKEPMKIVIKNSEINNEMKFETEIIAIHSKNDVAINKFDIKDKMKQKNNNVTQILDEIKKTKPRDDESDVVTVYKILSDDEIKDSEENSHFKHCKKDYETKDCNMKSIKISDSEIMKYCLKCSSIFDTDVCKYCIKKCESVQSEVNEGCSEQ